MINYKKLINTIIIITNLLTLTVHIEAADFKPMIFSLSKTRFGKILKDLKDETTVRASDATFEQFGLDPLRWEWHVYVITMLAHRGLGIVGHTLIYAERLIQENVVEFFAADYIPRSHLDVESYLFTQTLTDSVEGLIRHSSGREKNFFDLKNSNVLMQLKNYSDTIFLKGVIITEEQQVALQNTIFEAISHPPKFSLLYSYGQEKNCENWVRRILESINIHDDLYFGLDELLKETYIVNQLFYDDLYFDLDEFLRETYAVNQFF